MRDLDSHSNNMDKRSGSQSLCPIYASYHMPESQLIQNMYLFMRRYAMKHCV